MFTIPEVLNTLLMGGVCLVVVVTVVRPAMLHGMTASSSPSAEVLHQRAIEAIHLHLMQHSERMAPQRAAEIRYQRLLYGLPDQPDIRVFEVLASCEPHPREMLSDAIPAAVGNSP